MNFIFTWVLDLFKKPEDQAPWPFPAPVKAQRKRKPATKKPAAKKTVRKKKE